MIGFAIKEEQNVLISLELVDGTVVLLMNGLQIAYFDEEGLNLLPECTYEGKIPSEILDVSGYLKIRKAM